MNLIIQKNTNHNIEQSQLPIIFSEKGCIIKASEFLNKWTNNKGDSFFVLGDIVGIRQNDFKHFSQVQICCESAKLGK